MIEIVIENKKYVLLQEAAFKDLQKKAALKMKPKKTMTVEEVRTYNKQLIQK